MKVEIETHPEGVCWKLKALQNNETIAASIVYFSTIGACLEDLGGNARTWESYLLDRTVATVGEVKIHTDGVVGATLGEVWPDLS